MAGARDDESAGWSPTRLEDVLPPIAAFVVLVGVWAAVAALASVPSFLLPSPAAVAGRLIGNPTLYATNALATLERVVYGGAVGVAGGFLLAVVIDVVRPLRYAVLPYVVTIRVLPKIAIAPVLVIYVGTGRTTSLTLVAVIAFFPMVLSTIAGLDRTNRRYEDLLRSVDADRIRTFYAVRLRFAVPDIVAGFKQSVTLSVVGAIVAEWVVVDDGLGALVLVAAENLLTDVMLAALVILLLEGLVLYGVVVLLERRLLWDESG